MALANMRDLLRQADAQKRAVGAFNVSTIEMMCGVVKAAEELQTPVILQVAQIRLATTPLPLLGRAMYEAASRAKVPVALHLDHGTTMDCIQLALDLGFTSVMYDGSALSMEDNIARTQDVVRLAEKYGAAVEAEIGSLGRTETGEETVAAYTNPADAIIFAHETHVDALAVAIGNAHGVYAGTPTFHFEVLDAVHAGCDTPLVLHGGTGSSETNFRRCIESGVRKINIATAIFQAAARAVHTVTADNWFAMSRAMTQSVTDVVKEHICIFGRA